MKCNPNTRDEINRASLLLFVLIFSIYALTVSTSREAITAGEGFIRKNVLENLLTHGKIDIGGPDYNWGALGVGGRKYNWHEFGQNIFVLPLYLLMRGTGYAFFLLNIISTALTAVFMARILHALGITARAAVFSGAAYAFGTLAWHYGSRVPHEHATSVMLSVAAVYYIVLYVQRGSWRWLVISFLCVGFGFVTRYDAVLILPPAIAYCYLSDKTDGRMGRTFRTVLLAALVMLPFVVANMLYSYARFGDFFDTGRSWQYPAGDFSVFSIKYIPVGIVGAIFSPGKSVFLFSPPALLGLFYVRSLKERIDRSAFVMLCSIVLIYSGFYFTNFSFDGETSFGPRYFLPVLPFLCMPLAALFERWPETSAVKRRLLIVFFVAVLLVQAMFVSTQTGLSSVMKFGLKQGPGGVVSHDRVPGNQGTWRWVMSYYVLGDSEYLNQIKVFRYTALHKAGLMTLDEIGAKFDAMEKPYMRAVLHYFSTGFDLWWVQLKGIAVKLAALGLLCTAAGALFMLTRVTAPRNKLRV